MKKIRKKYLQCSDNLLNFSKEIENTFYNNSNKDYELSIDFRSVLDRKLKKLTIKLIYLDTTQKTPVEYITKRSFSNDNSEKFNIPINVQHKELKLWKIIFKSNTFTKDNMIYIWKYEKELMKQKSDTLQFLQQGK